MPSPVAATISGQPGGLARWSSIRADQGRSWESYSTGQPLPLHALHFIDSKHGWAVGELGLVLATADGGKTWKRQREGGQRRRRVVHPCPAGRRPVWRRGYAGR